MSAAPKSNLFPLPTPFPSFLPRAKEILDAHAKLQKEGKGLWLPAVTTSNAKARLGEKWFSLSMALRLGPAKKWASAATYAVLELETGSFYNVVWVHLGLLSPQFNTPKLFVDAVQQGIKGLDYDVPGDGTYLDDVSRTKRERAIARTPRNVRDDFFKGLFWPMETRSGTPLSVAGTKRSHDAARDDDDDSEDDDCCDDSDDSDDDSDDSDDDDDSNRDNDDGVGGENDDADVLQLGLPEKRRFYTTKEREGCLALLRKVGGNKEAALRVIHRTSGYEQVTHKNLTRWQTSTAKKNMGRKVNVDFERAVIGHLILTVLEKVEVEVSGTVNKVEKARVVANVAYSYEIIKLAADTTRKEAPWASDAMFLKLKFSNKWVKGFLRRSTLRRRRNTSSVKAVPSPEVVAARMKQIQAVIEAGPPGGQPDGQSQKYEKKDIYSADETASHYALKPLNQYVPKGNKRGSSPAFDDKARFTTMLYGDGEGVMQPPLNIIKCTVHSVDLRSSTVISTLHKKEGFRQADGWTLKTWDRELVLKVKGEDKTLHYYRPYIVHTDGTVITTQHKAWMDSVGMCMWADLVIGPAAKSSGRKKLIVWDSCGPHTVPAVKAVFASWDIAIEALPVNMTDALQVMDLVVNGPLKAHMRRFRCASLFDYFQSWKVKWALELEKPLNTRVMPAFLPPKPLLIDGLNTLKTVAKDVFSTPEFKKGVASAFVKVGLVKDSSGKFVEYTSHSRGDMLLSLAPADSVKAEDFTRDAVVDLDADLDAAEEADDESDDGPDAAEGHDDESDDE
jgi:hypothetical protein